MRFLPLLLLSLVIVSAENAKKEYAVVPNTGRFPFPTSLPQFTEARLFDWQKYIDGSSSEADRAFRVRLAYTNDHLTVDGQDSDAAQRQRATLAGREYQAKCEDLAGRYRAKLKSNPEALEKLNALIEHGEKAIQLQVDFIESSWRGSGAGTAAARARMHAYINYYQSLEDLGASLGLQDLPAPEPKARIKVRPPQEKG